MILYALIILLITTIIREEKKKADKRKNMFYDYKTKCWYNKKEFFNAYCNDYAIT